MHTRMMNKPKLHQYIFFSEADVVEQVPILFMQVSWLTAGWMVYHK